MKKLIVILFLSFFCSTTIAQNVEPFRIDSLPKPSHHWALLGSRTSLYSLKLGVLLDKGWKFQLGDNPNFAKTNFDDSQWQSVNPAQNFHSIPTVQNGISWFRIYLQFSPTIERDLALLIEQNGASEVYLNGKLVKKLGTVSINPKEVKAYNPVNLPILMHLDSTSTQVLAIRYAQQSNVHYSTVFFDENYALKIQINKLSTAIETQQKISNNFQINFSIRVGIFIIMAILHLSFFFFYPPNKANLFFSLYAIAAILGYGEQIRWLALNDLQARYISSLLSFNANSLSYIFLLVAFSYLLNQKRGLIFGSLIILAVISMPLSIMVYGWGWKIGAMLFNIFINLEIARVVFVSIRNKQKGTWILGIGVVQFLIFWPIFILQNVFGLFLSLSGLPFTIAILSIPIVTSIYLGLEFGFINKSLSKRLKENQTLTDQIIVQEKEKQQILATQNETLEKQVIERTAELNKSLVELKSTQTQLIQSEKLASLGELTAGIAHEIQNPLNFVNNFSEVSVEISNELKEEAQKPEIDKGLIFDLATDLALNQEKINHHGKRAASIVKGMLEHSRTSSSVKELTDINALADEYLRLAYHGLRAKDSTFNADFELIADKNLPKIEVIPQDMGRVLLNLINNAFWAVNERNKKGETGYEPKVTISTQLIANSQLLIAIKDNGTGMTEDVKAKIFQPFFTTKPAGQGTGLGLSLAYDIVTKRHGGTLEVNSTEGIGSEFIVTLPFKTNVL